MLNFLKNTQKKLEKLLVDKDLISIQEKSDDIFKLNFGFYNIFIWKKSLSANFHDKSLLDKKLKECNEEQNNYCIFNLTNKPIDGIEHEEKVFNLKTPEYPAYTLLFIIEFSLLLKDILLNKGPGLSLIFYDTYESVSYLLYFYLA